jgi:iron complex outermembrane recepter protein
VFPGVPILPIADEAEKIPVNLIRVMPAQGRNKIRILSFQHFPLINFLIFKMKKQMKRIFLLSTILVGAFSLYAQNDSTRKDSFYVLSPVEVRATRVNEKAPFAVSNVMQKEISKTNLGAGLPYLLSQSPSIISSSDDGAGVGYSSLRIRGTDITRINITMNGIPVNDPESQGTFFVDIPDIASSTHSIQIQRGVGASTNGAGAFGASINISNVEQSKMPSVSYSSAYGSFNTWKNTLQAGTGLFNGGFQFDVRLSKINSSGYIDRAFSDLKSLHFIAGWTSKDENTNIKFNLLTGKERTGQAWNGIGTYYTDQDNPATVDYEKQLNKTGRTTNTLGEISPGKYYSDQTDNYQQDYYQLFVNHKFNSQWSANVSGFLTRGRGYYNEYKNSAAFSAYGLPNFVKAAGDTLSETDLVRQLWLDNYYYGTVLSANCTTEKTIITIGGALTDYDGKNYGIIKWAHYNIPVDYKWYDLPSHKGDYNGFIKWQQQLASRLYAFADVQLRYVDYKINGFRENPTDFVKNYYTFFNPKFGLSYLMNHQHSSDKVFASFAVANKEPNRDDFETSLTDKPKPERLNDFEAGYQYSTTKFSTGVTVYYMKYKDQLILTGKINDVGAYVRTNVGNSYRAGAELTTDLRPANWVALSANVTFSQNKIKTITQFGDDYDNGGQIAENFQNTDITLSPNTIVGATASFEPFYKNSGKQHFYIDLVEKYISRQYLDNSSNKLRSINPYSLTDVRLRYQLSTKTFKNFGIIVMANNIFNKKYENNGYTFSYKYDGSLTTENYYFPQAGINWNVGISIAL